jgi:hypothetical protein
MQPNRLEVLSLPFTVKKENTRVSIKDKERVQGYGIA